MSVNKLSSSIGKSKIFRNTAIAAALFAAVVGNQSCADKNKGMPIRLQEMNISAAENTEKSSEMVKINDNKVSLNYVSNGTADWDQKSINYSIEIDKHEDGKIIVLIEWDSYYGAESDRGATPEFEKKFETELSYGSIEEFNQKFTNECNAYLDEAMADVMKNKESYQENVSEYDSEFSSKTELLTGWLKYMVDNKHIAQKNPAQKEGNIVVVPFARKGQNIRLTLQKPNIETVVVNKAWEKSYGYDLKINSKKTQVYITDDAITSAQAIFDKLPDSIKKHISEQDKYEKFLPKCLEAVQLLKE